MQVSLCMPGILTIRLNIDKHFYDNYNFGVLEIVLSHMSHTS